MSYNLSLRVCVQHQRGLLPGFPPAWWRNSGEVSSGEGKGSGSELCLLSNSIIWGAFTFEPPPALGSLSQSASFPVHTIKNV